MPNNGILDYDYTFTRQILQAQVNSIFLLRNKTGWRGGEMGSRVQRVRERKREKRRWGERRENMVR